MRRVEEGIQRAVADYLNIEVPTDPVWRSLMMRIVK